MLWWADTEFSVKPWRIAIILALVRPLIPNMVASWLLKKFHTECWFPCYLFPLYFQYLYVISDSRVFPFYASQFICTDRVFVCTSILGFILCSFFPHSVAENYSLHYLFIFINLASAHCNFTKPASRRSPCGVPITEMNPHPIPLRPILPTPYSYRHHQYLQPDTIETWVPAQLIYRSH